MDDDHSEPHSLRVKSKVSRYCGLLQSYRLLTFTCTDLQTVAFFAALGITDVPLIDFNLRSTDGALGGSLPSFTIDEHHNRSSVRERLLDVEQSSGRLTLSLDTLATKLLMCNGTDGKPTAYGVEMAPGAALAVAGNFNGKIDLDPMLRNVTVKREVIVSAGVFQSPQLVGFCHSSSQVFSYSCS
jgi:choline dehydrogenase